MRSILPLLLLAAVAFAGAVYAASEFGGPVVTLRTSDSDGRVYETRLWRVRDGPNLWLRAGSADSRWVQRIHDNPDVELEERGETREYTAVPAPEATERINDLMEEEYGFADQLVGWVRDRSNALAIRLDPRRE